MALLRPPSLLGGVLEPPIKAPANTVRVVLATHVKQQVVEKDLGIGRRHIHWPIAECCATNRDQPHSTPHKAHHHALTAEHNPPGVHTFLSAGETLALACRERHALATRSAHTAGHIAAIAFDEDEVVLMLCHLRGARGDHIAGASALRGSCAHADLCTTRVHVRINASNFRHASRGKMHRTHHFSCDASAVGPHRCGPLGKLE